MAPRIIFLALAASLFIQGVFAAPRSITLKYRVINNFPVKYVTVDLHDPEVVVTSAIAHSFPNQLEGWGSFLGRLRPDAAINGTYFSVRTHIPVGDIACNGALVYRGLVGTAFCLRPDNSAEMRPGSRDTSVDWTGYRTVISAGPRLLTDGQVTLVPRAEGFRDPHVLGSAPRSAIALCDDGLMLLIAIPRNISLRNLAWVCRKLGARQAMALDGGSSSALYASNRTVTRPGRALSNILAVYATPARYASVIDQFDHARLTVLASLCPPMRPQPVIPSPEPVLPLPAVTLQQASLPATPTLPLAFIEPDQGRTISKSVPISIKYADDERIAMCTLYINGQLQAVSNTRALTFLWDCSKEVDGTYTLEATIWGRDNRQLATISRTLTVANHEDQSER